MLEVNFISQKQLKANNKIYMNSNNLNSKNKYWFRLQ